MNAIHTKLQKVGNSRGVVIPKLLLVQAGLDDQIGVELTLEGDAIVVRRARAAVRQGWAEAAQRIAEAADDALVMGEFGNAIDDELIW